ncbi:MAG: tetratricopeptide repeat protein [Woeseiaceae bacterium]
MKRPIKSLVKKALPLSLALVLSIGATSSIAVAQNEEPQKRETKKAEALSKAVYDKLTKAQESVDAKDWQGAIRIIDGLLRDEKITNFERGNVYNFKGFIEYSRDNIDGAIRAYEQLIGIAEVEEQMKQQTTYTIAQLYAAQERFPKTIEYLDRWFTKANNPPPEAYVLLAQAYSQTNEFRKMLDPLDKAIAEAKRREVPVREDWYNLKYYACYQTENYRCVRDTLKILVAGWPKKSYWMALGGIYSELEEEKNMLGVYEAMFTAGVLNSESEQVTMAQLYLQGEIPFKGAVVLENGMNDGTISKNAKNYRLLSQAWALAAEDIKAIPALREAARLSTDGDLDARLAISYLNTDQYSECVDAGRASIRKGGLRRPSDSNITVGMCLYNMDRLGPAKQEFRKAMNDERSRTLASQWVKVIESDEARLEQLRIARQQVRRDREASEPEPTEESTPEPEEAAATEAAGD